MKPFNLKEALAGKPVVTRNGRPVTQLTHMHVVTDSYSLVGVMRYKIETWTTDGKFLRTPREHVLDLFMASTKKSGYIAIGPIHQSNGNPLAYGSCVYDTAEAAAKSISTTTMKPYAVILVEWEE